MDFLHFTRFPIDFFPKSGGSVPKSVISPEKNRGGSGIPDLVRVPHQRTCLPRSGATSAVTSSHPGKLSSLVCCRMRELHAFLCGLLWRLLRALLHGLLCGFLCGVRVGLRCGLLPNGYECIPRYVQQLSTALHRGPLATTVSLRRHTFARQIREWCEGGSNSSV